MKIAETATSVDFLLAVNDLVQRGDTITPYATEGLSETLAP